MPTKPDKYYDPDPDRFADEFGLRQAARVVADDGGDQPTIGVVDTPIIPTEGDGADPDLFDLGDRRRFGTVPTTEPRLGETYKRVSPHGTKSAFAAAGDMDAVYDVPSVSEAKLLAAEVGVETGYDDPYGVAMRWAVDNGADVLSLAFSRRDTAAIRDAIDYAHSKGVVMVTSAGNHDEDIGDLREPFPQAHSAVITVGATDTCGQWADFPDWTDYSGGKQPRWASAYPADVCAWGTHVPSIDRDDVSTRHGRFPSDETPNWWKPTAYGCTSAATAVVAGVVARMLRVNPGLSATDVRTILRQTGTDIDPARPIGPVVHAGRAVETAATW